MKTVAYNERQLDVIVRDMYNRLNEFGSLQIDYQKPFKEKTQRQLGFFFGGLVDSVISYYEDFGQKWDKDDVKSNFYKFVSETNDDFKRKVTNFDGKEYFVPKTLSKMSVEEASEFIDKTIYIIEHAKCFKGLILHPSLRYTWIRHITKDDIDSLRFTKLPREDKTYLEHQRKQACLVCGKQNCSEVHHLKEAGFTGTAYKADDWLSIPLCHDCHIAGFHTQGKHFLEDNLSWITKYISLVDFCRINYLKWLNKK